MRVTMYMCMPEGDAMRTSFGELLEVQKRDNRAVIRAMLDAGMDVPDTVGELGLSYDPEQHRHDDRGHPIMAIYGFRDMVERKKFSCGCAAAYESAIMEEKYGIPTICLAVAQGDVDCHAIYVTAERVVDPTANYLLQQRYTAPTRRSHQLPAVMCRIGDEGRVVCDDDDPCCVGTDGIWRCPKIPGLSGRKEKIGKIHRTPGGQAWAWTPEGAVVPICKGH